MIINDDPNPHLELGTIIGKSQAFAVLTNMSAGAQAACLRDIRDKETYKLTGLSWNDFCPRYRAAPLSILSCPADRSMPRTGAWPARRGSGS